MNDWEMEWNEEGGGAYRVLVKSNMGNSRTPRKFPAHTILPATKFKFKTTLLYCTEARAEQPFRTAVFGLF